MQSRKGGWGWGPSPGSTSGNCQLKDWFSCTCSHLDQLSIPIIPKERGHQEGLEDYMGCNKTVKLLSFVFKHKVLKVHLPGFVEM